MPSTSSRVVPPSEEAKDVLDYVEIITPIFLFVFFVASFLTNNIVEARKAQKAAGDDAAVVLGPGGRPLPKRMKSSTNVESCKPTSPFSEATRLFFLVLTASLLATFVANGAIIVAQAVVYRDQNWWCGQSPVVYVLGTCFVYSLVLITMIETKPCPNISHLMLWVAHLPFDIILLGASIAFYSGPHNQPVVGDPSGGRLSKSITPWELVEIVVIFVRLFILFVSVVTYLGILATNKFRRRRTATSTPEESTETTRLLASNQRENGRANGHVYGTHHPGAESKDTKEGEEGWCRPKTQQTKSWYEYIAGYRVFFPYLWPSKSARLQLITLICFALVILQRVINVLVPMQVGVITKILAGKNGENPRVPWGPICLYVLFRMLQGSQGLVGALRSYLWIRVGQYSYRELSTAAFEHVHSLSLDFHIGKKTGEVISALNKGNSINQFLELVTFSVGPMLFDLVVAIGYFLFAFDAYYALVVTIVVFYYLYITIKLATWRNNIRRKMTDADRQEEAVKQDSLTLYETVKYFNAEKYEFNRYRKAIVDFQVQEYIVAVSLNILNTAQNTCFMVGLLVTCFIAGYQVSIGQQDVGGFTTLLVYMSQLQAPLNFVGSFYRTIQQSLINAERMLELFKEQPTVVDAPSAKPMPHCHGKVEFKNVGFSYDKRRPALNGLSFECQPGTTTALVGESGGGKSTVFRLLFRFYNPESGKVLVDGQDVQDVTIDSLRSYIGVVPQETLLFNETLMYNLKYARQSATDEEVYEACRAASIHDKIMAFPDKYESKVGERGLRLSGGEKQRVAIARTILKNPKIIMLDEATAALDTETEEHIQEALSALAAGRTSLVIAHRLSTITKADQILVLTDGKVAEKGTHEELLAQNGKYASMWRKQIRAQKAAVEAHELQQRANRLLETGGGDSNEQSEDEREINRILQPNDSEQAVRPGDSAELGPAMASL